MSKPVSVKKITTTKSTSLAHSFPIVAIGASLGGLEAMTELLKSLPSNTGMAFIYVQHLSPNHKSILSQLLSKVSKMKVQEIDQLLLIQPNTVYVMPPDKGIEVTDGHIKPVPRAKGASAISIDVLFSSLAETHRSQVIGIILSGNAADGQQGITAIKLAGGITFAQDSSAQASSMPESAIASGAVDHILSPKKIALELILLSKNKFAHFYKTIKQNLLEYKRIDLVKLFDYLKAERGLDFNNYKLPTIKRRLKQRMLKCNTSTINAYLHYIQKNNDEVDELYASLLINVTSFFRDASTFTYLKRQILPLILKSKKEEEEVRVWVPACATGQEAYSIAMLVLDLLSKSKKSVKLKLFATDLSEQAIAYSRKADYKLSEVKSVPKNYLDRYFIRKGDSYQIGKELREVCMFAVHNILRDPPFSRMDLVTCRNMLIYFEPNAQKQVFNSLHFALKEDGFLMLGRVESIGTSSLLFKSYNKVNKVFLKKKNLITKTTFELAPFFKAKTNEATRVSAHVTSKTNTTLTTDAVVDQLLLAEYVPACVVVNQEFELLQSKGDVSSFLKLSSGRASLSILKITRPELSFELRSLLFKTLKTKRRQVKLGVESKIEGVLRKIDLEVRPILSATSEDLYLIVFKVQDKSQKLEKNLSPSKLSDVFKLKIKELQTELTSMRSEMNVLIETQEEVFAELQSANEENVSANEEFQTLNEELETSKEEVEASNEELLSANRELQKRNDLLTEFHEYSEAITATIHEPMLVMYTDFKVKSANHAFYEKFKLKKENTEGKKFFELNNGQWNIDILQQALHEIVSKNSDFKDLELRQSAALGEERVLLVNAHFVNQKTNKKKLILLAIEDITILSNYYLKENIERKREEVKFRGFLESAPDAIVIVNTSGEIELVNSEAEKLFGYGRSEIVGKKIELLLPARFEATHLQHRKQFSGTDKARVMGQGKALFAKRKDGHEFPVQISLSQIETQDGKLISTAIRDITKQKADEAELLEAKLTAERAQEKAEEAMQAKQQFLSTMSHEIRTPMNAIIGFANVVLKTDLSARQKEYMNAIKTSGDVLIVLINGILDLAKVDAGKMEFEQIPFELSTCLSSMFNIFEADISAKNLKLVKSYDHNIPQVLIGDAIRLNQILLNLVSNAVKFTSVGEIGVSVMILKEDASHVCLQFTVSDTGIGIAEDKIDSIFEKFQQATAGTSRLYGGTGLGLAIAKQLVERQGGNITIVSKLGQGSSFIFTLNFLKTAKQMAVESEKVQVLKTKNKVRILLVEDVPLNQLLMKTVLEDFDFEMELAENGQVAIDKLKTAHFDLVLMDLQMPVMNGFEATEYIRKTLQLTLPILALTADVSSIDEKKCKAIGMNDYISKPIDEKLLYSKILTLVGTQPAVQVNRDADTSGNSAAIHVTSGPDQHPHLRLEIISIFLKQTPLIVAALMDGFAMGDWPKVQAAVHKLLPSITIMRLSSELTDAAQSVLDGHKAKVDLNVYKSQIVFMKKSFDEACVLFGEILKTQA